MTYGYCPNCGREGKARERSPNGKTYCKGGHAFLSTKWDEYNKKNKSEPKRKGWFIKGKGFVDFAKPVTYAEAEASTGKIFAEMEARLAEITGENK